MQIKQLFIPSVYTNCYLAASETGSKAVVIDPGAAGGNLLSTIEKFLTDGGFTLSAILLTHGHYDHVGGVSALREKYPDVPVYLHPLDVSRADGELFPVAGLGELLPLADGQKLIIGDMEFTVLHTPGHTEGSVCFLCGDVLFTGDTLFCGSCGRTDFPGGSWEMLMDSLKKLSALKGDYQVLPGHDALTTLEAERRTNPFLRTAVGQGG